MAILDLQDMELGRTFGTDDPKGGGGGGVSDISLLLCDRHDGNSDLSLLLC
jgi:Lanthionine-containing peptide SapB precursor RamS